MVKKIAKTISKIGAPLYGVKGLIRKTGQHIVLPFYHSVANNTPIHIQHLYQSRSITSFKADLDFLLTHYKSISLHQLIELNDSDEEIDENYFHITFDDGLREFYDVVAPILKEKQVHATVFLNSDFIDNKQLFYRFKESILFDKLKDKSILSIPYSKEQHLDELALLNQIDFDAYLKEASPYLTSEQIKELIGDGITFGAHSKNHPLYKEISLEEQLVQTNESVKMITSQFGLDYSAFSFPFTDDGVSLAFFDKIYICNL